MKKFHNRAKVSSTWTKSVINYFNLDSNFPRCVEGPNVNLYGFIGCEDWARKEYCVLKDNVALLLDTEVSFPIFFQTLQTDLKTKICQEKFSIRIYIRPIEIICQMATQLKHKFIEMQELPLIDKILLGKLGPFVLSRLCI